MFSEFEIDIDKYEQLLVITENANCRQSQTDTNIIMRMSISVFTILLSAIGVIGWIITNYSFRVEPFFANRNVLWYYKI